MICTEMFKFFFKVKYKRLDFNSSQKGADLSIQFPPSCDNFGENITLSIKTIKKKLVEVDSMNQFTINSKMGRVNKNSKARKQE